MYNFVWKVEAWENDEFIITVRPDWESPSKAVPIGATLHKKDAKVVARWLHFSEYNLRTLFWNEFTEEIKNDPEYKRLNQELDKLRKEIYG